MRPSPTLHPAHRPFFGLPAKRIFDIAVSGTALLLLSPLLLLIALAVRLDSPGPIFHMSERTGRYGVRFRMLKFRTMVRDADRLKEELRHLSIVPWPDFKVVPDPRITRVGRFLRATSLDELPQLWNVLRGDMSIVGPRPTTFGVDTYDVWHTARLDVPPGLTGQWQVFGRNTTTFDERVRLDVQYIRSRSLGLDLKLIALTAVSVLRREGA